MEEPQQQRQRVVTLTIGHPDHKLMVYMSTLQNACKLEVLATMFKREEMLHRLPDGSVFVDADYRVFSELVARLRRQRMPLDPDYVPEGINPEEWVAELDYWGYKENNNSNDDEDGEDHSTNNKDRNEGDTVSTVIRKKRKRNQEEEEESVHQLWARRIIERFHSLIKDAGLYELSAINGKSIELESFAGTTWEVHGKQVDLFQWMASKSDAYKKLITKTLGCRSFSFVYSGYSNTKRADPTKRVAWPASDLKAYRDITQEATYSATIEFK
jgi:hypothetical protein